jgi:hypothetical protein
MDEQKPWKPVLINSKTNRQIAYVMDHTNTIEYVLKGVLTRYINAPSSRETFVQDILLHSSIINLGGKFKLLHHIVEYEGWPKLDRNHFHTLLNIRNAFAHSDTATVPPIPLYVGGTKEERIARRSSADIPDRIVTMLDSSGRFRSTGRGKALNEFTQSYVAILDYLNDLSANKLE